MDIEKILSELTLEEKAGLCSGMDFWNTKAVERLGIPSVMMCDATHGLRKQEGAGDHMGLGDSIETVCYPTAAALASSFDREVLGKLGDVLGEECQAENIGMLLGPGLNMKRSPQCGRNFEYFSEDPYLAGELAASYIKALQEKGVAACVKHFAANNQETRRMSSSSNMDERTLNEIYLPAFETAIKKGGVRSVMCAYNAVNNIYCAENPELLTDILRKQWGYEGFVVTDWGAVKDRVVGLKAGLDLEMPGGTGTQDQKIVEAVEKGELDEEILNSAVRNILKFVFDCQEQHKEGVVIDREAASALSEKFSEQCAVLMKNENVLPLDRKSKVAFIGAFAEEPRYQGGGSSHVNVKHSVSALEATKNVFYARGYDAHSVIRDTELETEAVRIAADCDAAVIFAGLPDKFETEACDRTTMQMPENQNKLIEAVSAVQPNTIVVLHTGSPVEMPWLDLVSGVLCMYLGGERVGEAAVRLLYSDAVPCGKLAETWPVKLEDNPAYLNFPGVGGQVEYKEGVFIGYRYYDKKKMQVNFPFGHGLSYTNFTYSNLIIEKEVMKDTEQLTVSCKIKNSGGVDAKEVVQLYVRNAAGEAVRPIRELKGFEKVELRKGEEKTVSFILDKRAFSYYEPKLCGWYAESGSYGIEIGASSRDIRLQGTVWVDSTEELPVHYTMESTLGDLLRTAKGKRLAGQILPFDLGSTEAAISSESNKSMGEGTNQMMQAVLKEMPLSALVTFCGVSREKIETMISELNV